MKKIKPLNLGFPRLDSLFKRFEIPFFFDFLDQASYRFASYIYDFSFDLSNSCFFAFLDLGFKQKATFFFNFFFNFISLDKRLRHLYFAKEFKFLVFNSFNNIAYIGLNKNTYLGYFPLSYFNFVSEINLNLFNKFSIIAKTKSYKFNPLTNLKENVEFSLDTHFSELFYFQGYLPKIIDEFRLFPYYVTEWTVVNDNYINISLLVQDNMSNFTSTRAFFKKLFFNKFFKYLKKFLIKRIFMSFFFLEEFFLTFLNFYLDFFYRFWFNSLKYFFFIKRVFTFVKILILLKTFVYLFNNFYLFNFFMIEFCFFFCKKFTINKKSFFQIFFFLYEYFPLVYNCFNIFSQNAYIVLKKKQLFFSDFKRLDFLIVKNINRKIKVSNKFPFLFFSNIRKSFSFGLENELMRTAFLILGRQKPKFLFFWEKIISHSMSLLHLFLKLNFFTFQEKKTLKIFLSFERLLVNFLKIYDLFSLNKIKPNFTFNINKFVKFFKAFEQFIGSNSKLTFFNFFKLMYKFNYKKKSFIYILQKMVNSHKKVFFKRKIKKK